MPSIRGFIDGRTDAQKLADEKPPKEVKYTKKNPLSSKFLSALSKVAGLTSGASGATIGKYLLTGAAKSLVAQAGTSIFKAITGKFPKQTSSIQKLASVALGAKIIEITDPKKLILPLLEGASINPAQAAKALSSTTAYGIQSSLITNIPLAKGVPSQIIQFKSLAKIKSSPRFFDITKATTLSTANTLVNTAITLVQQRGMLQDEIMYRLVLLAENVYDPISEYCVNNGLGAPVILEGFRSENSSTSQHERGEAMDIALQNNTSQNLYNLAIWIRDNVSYDQLILCHSNIAGGQSWIHISFSPNVRRRQVLTKTFNDLFEPGLHIYSSYIDLAKLATDKAIASQNDKISEDLIQRFAAREAKLNPVSVNTQEQLQTLLVGSSASRGADGRGGVPSSKPIFVGRPVNPCTLPAMPENDNFNFESGSYQEQVEAAQAEVFLLYGNNPAWFNTNGSIVADVQYCEGVATVLRSWNFCAQAGPSGSPDEIGIKTTNEFNDQYDIILGGSNLPHTLYVGSHRPSRF